MLLTERRNTNLLMPCWLLSSWAADTGKLAGQLTVLWTNRDDCGWKCFVRLANQQQGNLRMRSLVYQQDLFALAKCYHMMATSPFSVVWGLDGRQITLFLFPPVHEVSILGTFGQVAMAVFSPRRVFFCAKLMLGMDSESWKPLGLTCHMLLKT